MKVFSNRSAIAKYTIVVALIIGLVIGGVAGWFSKPAERVTETVTETVTQTVTAPITPTPAKRLLRAGFSWPTYIDPAVGSDMSSSASLVNLYDPILWPTPEGYANPWVAESWTVSPDGLVWTFTLRKGIKFHTGRELTAEDVAFSMERLLTIGEGYSYIFAPYVDKVEVVDDYTVQFTLKRTFGPFLISLFRLYVLDKEEVMANIKTPGPYEELGDYGKEWLLTHDAGSGAFKVKEVKLEDYVHMVKFEDYWAPVAPNSPTEMIFMATALSPPTTRTMMLGKELEITDQWVPEEILDALAATPGISVMGYPQGSEYYHMMNTKKPPLDDIHVRKALAYCFDYDTMIEEIYSRYTISTSSVPKGLPGYVNTQTFYYDLAKAEEELKLSKYYPDIVENPEKYVIEMHWIADVPERERDSLLLAESAAKIGLRVELVKTPWMKTVEEMADLETSGHMYCILVAAHYPEAGSLLESRYHSKSAATWEQNEWLQDPVFDEMLEDALATVDVDERFAKYAEVQRYLMELCPSIFLYDYRAVVAYQDYVDWPAMKDPSKVISVMGYNYDGRTWQVLPPE